MRAMGGKGETSDQKIRATQDQLRLARITQEVNPVEDDRANIQKLIKKIVETTHCLASQAELALLDNDYNVEEAVNAILEETYTDANMWKEQKSRRAKRLEAEEKGDETAPHRSNRSHPTRCANNFSGAGRGRGSERGRGGFRGGTRGAHGGRGGYQSAPPPGSASSASNVWDNSQATKTDTTKEWITPTTNPVEEIPEDTDWKTAGTLVFSRRDDITQAAAPALTSSASGTSSVTTSSVSAPISFAAVAAAGASKAKEATAGSVPPSAPKVAAPVSGTSSVSSASSVTPVPSQSAANSVSQSQIDSINSLYQNSGIVSTSSQLSTGSGMPSEEAPVTVGGGGSNREREESLSLSPPVSISCVLAATATPSASVNAATSVNTASNASADWTAQLKSDLGIGSKAAVPVPSPRPNTLSKSPPTQSKPLSVSRPLPTMMAAQHPTHTVEFVSGDLNGSSALPEYQFGFHVDPVATSEERNEDVFVSSKQRSLNSHQKVEGDMCADSSSVLSGSTISDFTSSISQQPKGVSASGGVNMTPVAPAAGHSTVSGLSRHSASSGLSYADTSSMSYPSSENRTSNVKPSLSLHQQQQAQHQLYTATQIPYNSYPYLNMYSPVTGVRQDEAQYAAALVQYPFGMGQIDMSSLSTMLPPAALASQQQPSQPPPPVQSQHQQRPDQHGNYVDIKAYAAAAVANSTAGGGSGSALLGSQQQQRDSSSVSSSAVAPPPGFSGPPSNMPAATFTLPQHNHLSSLFQMPPTYHPQLNQLPFSFMLPNVTGNGQHKLGHQMFAQQTVEESLSDQRLSSQQQKVYGGGHQQMEKYGTTSGGKDRLGGGAQATPPPQIYQPQAAQSYLSQPMQMHAHSKKAFNGPQHWSAS